MNYFSSLKGKIRYPSQFFSSSLIYRNLFFRVSVKANVKPDLEVIQSFTQPTFRIINLRPNITYHIVISANNTHGRSRPHELVARTKGKTTIFFCLKIFFTRLLFG